MKTRVTCQRGSRIYEWQGDAPYLPEGAAITLAGVAMTRVQVNTVVLMDGEEPLQRIVAGP